MSMGSECHAIIFLSLSLSLSGRYKCLRQLRIFWLTLNKLLSHEANSSSVWYFIAVTSHWWALSRYFWITIFPLKDAYSLHAGAAHMILERIMAYKTFVIVLRVRPCFCSCRSRYKHWLATWSVCSICLSADKVDWIMTPNTLAQDTLYITRPK